MKYLKLHYYVSRLNNAQRSLSGVWSLAECGTGLTGRGALNAQRSLSGVRSLADCGTGLTGRGALN